MTITDEQTEQKKEFRSIYHLGQQKKQEKKTTS